MKPIPEKLTSELPKSLIARQYGYICRRLSPPLRTFSQYFLLCFLVAVLLGDQNQIFAGVRTSFIIGTIMVVIDSAFGLFKGFQFAAMITPNVRMDWTPNLTHLSLQVDKNIVWVPYRMISVFTEYQTAIPEWFIDKLQDQLINRQAADYKRNSEQDDNI